MISALNRGARFESTSYGFRIQEGPITRFQIMPCIGQVRYISGPSLLKVAISDEAMPVLLSRLASASL